MSALLQEIVSVYPLLSPPNLTAHVSNRVCNALALLQCVASHSETRQLFLSGGLHVYSIIFDVLKIGSNAAHIPLFLYPFLNTTSKTRPFEYLRLTSLGVIGALVKVDARFNAHILSEFRLAKRQQHCDPFPTIDGDYTPLPAHYGNGIRTLQDGGHLHRSENSSR